MFFATSYLLPCPASWRSLSSLSVSLCFPFASLQQPCLQRADGLMLRRKTVSLRRFFQAGWGFSARRFKEDEKERFHKNRIFLLANALLRSFLLLLRPAGALRREEENVAGWKDPSTPLEFSRLAFFFSPSIAISTAQLSLQCQAMRAR